MAKSKQYNSSNFNKSVIEEQISEEPILEETILEEPILNDTVEVIKEEPKAIIKEQEAPLIEELKEEKVDVKPITTSHKRTGKIITVLKTEVIVQTKEGYNFILPGTGKIGDTIEF